MSDKLWVKDAVNKVGEVVELFGWVQARRDHGKIIFIDLRDRSAVIQVVFTPGDKELYQLADMLRPEWVIGIKGKIAERPKGMINSELLTGNIEFQCDQLTILNQSEAPPISIDTPGFEIGEEHRLKYRYLDLRRERLKNNLTARHKIILFVRNWLNKQGFLEVETPILTKTTPEGARDYVVPSRIYPGKFFALPQSPQQYKQLLMAAGIQKYFQIARCFRDEDTRGDRQPEFTQLDLEVSFATREDIMKLNESLIIDAIKELYPEKEIQEVPFPIISYKEAMEKYKTERPDLRKDKDNPNLLAFCWIVDFPFFEKDDKGGWTFTHNPFSAPKDEFLRDLLEYKNIGEIITSQYDIVMNGLEIGGGSIRNHQPDALRAVFKIMGFEDKDVDNSFGHMLQAFSLGTPPHGGIAWGLDRFISLLQNEPNIREVIAFPKTGDGRDLVMDAPSHLMPSQLKELGIKIQKD